ncbi:glucokinase [Variovorax sp. PAMC 28711]|nr:glucokinase [Variovorax sp. PAMC 28711]
MKKKTPTPPVTATLGLHGATDLPSVIVESYNLEVRDEDGFVGDRASQTAFRKLLDAWRKRRSNRTKSRRLNRENADPLGHIHSADLTKREIDEALQQKRATELTDAVHGAIEEFAGELGDVIKRFSRQKAWKGVERIVIGGGFPESDVGERAILQAAVMLDADAVPIGLARLRHQVDDGGLIGWVHLAPPRMVTDYDAILALDIGGTNVRCGIVKPRHKKAADLSHAKVVKRIKWRHADDNPKQHELIDGLVDMLNEMVKYSERKGIRLAPFIGIGCPGVIRADGSIARGAQNLPGNWERDTFHLPTSLCERIPFINDEPTEALMHNDGVVQGLSELPFMQDVKRWAVLTIGTGLGNASYHNKKPKRAG